MKILKSKLLHPPLKQDLAQIESKLYEVGFKKQVVGAHSQLVMFPFFMVNSTVLPSATYSFPLSLTHDGLVGKSQIVVIVPLISFWNEYKEMFL